MLDRTENQPLVDDAEREKRAKIERRVQQELALEGRELTPEFKQLRQLIVDGIITDDEYLLIVKSRFGLID